MYENRGLNVREKVKHSKKFIKSIAKTEKYKKERNFIISFWNIIEA
jgi:hypothetical protein